MTQARQQDAWNHTASLLAMLANVNRDPRKGRAFKPADFHPLPAPRHVPEPPKPPPLRGDIGMLKAVFIQEGDHS